LRLYVKTTNFNSYIFVQSLSQLTSLELDFNRCDNRCILTTRDFKGAVFRTGAILFRDGGGDFETREETFPTKQIRRPETSFQQAETFRRGRLYFVTPDFESDDCRRVQDSLPDR